MAFETGIGKAPTGPELAQGVKKINESCTSVGKPNSGSFATAEPSQGHRSNKSAFGPGSTVSGTGPNFED